MNVISNSTINTFEYSALTHTINLFVSNSTSDQTFGFIRICIPHTLMNETYHVTINGTDPYYIDYTLADNGTHRWMYFVFDHSTLHIVIVPEFLWLIALPLFIGATLMTAKAMHAISRKNDHPHG